MCSSHYYAEALKTCLYIYTPQKKTNTQHNVPMAQKIKMSYIIAALYQVRSIEVDSELRAQSSEQTHNAAFSK
jgi:hypothetical protein